MAPADAPDRLRVLLTAPNIDGTDVGEAFVGFKWAAALSTQVSLSVLAFQRPGREDLTTQLPRAEVVTWPEPGWARRHERLNAMLKPAYPVYVSRVRRWIRNALAAGRQFDIAHQILPLAARYPSPLRGTGLPYVMGPLGGTLPTPEGFRGEMGASRWFTRLRALDGLRHRRDPFLRASYAQADLILGVAPYLAEALASIPLKRFEPVLELGVDEVPPLQERPAHEGLRLLHVGRAVRSKGLRDTIRALAQLTDLPGITLTSAGDGEDLAACREEAARLGVADRIRFLGRVPRAEVTALYRDADVFVFPSFREPTGGVLYEAMQAGLPIVTADYGGPVFVTDERCALRLPVSTPQALSRDTAAAIRRLHADPALRRRMGAAGQEKLRNEGLWPRKAEALTGLYREVLATASQGRAGPVLTKS